MLGKFVVGFIFLTSLIVGGLVYYLQVYAYYEEVAAPVGAYEMRLVSLGSGQPEPITINDFQGIDAYSSPLRFRGCFTTPSSIETLAEDYQVFDAAIPLVGPSWFDCYDAKAIGASLETGEATGFLAQRNISDGVDRVMAIYPDGRAYVWHQLNEKFAE